MYVDPLRVRRGPLDHSRQETANLFNRGSKLNSTIQPPDSTVHKPNSTVCPPSSYYTSTTEHNTTAHQPGSTIYTPTVYYCIAVEHNNSVAKE